MRRKRIFIVMAVCALVGIGVLAFWPGEREPEYNGKKLSEWLGTYPIFDDDEQRVREADDAIRHMGTNSLPWLVRWTAYKPPAWKLKIAPLVWKVPTRPTRNWYYLDHLRFSAQNGFRVLGPKAAPAVPALTQILKNSRDADNRELAISALRYIGKDGFPALLTALEDQRTEYLASTYILVMFRNGFDISQAIPGLLLMDRETEKFVKANPGRDSDYAIPQLEGSPGFLIPTLTDCLNHTNNDVRAEAAHALGRLREAARPAAPALREALDDRVIAVQEAAIGALEKIAPEVLTNGMKDF